MIEELGLRSCEDPCKGSFTIYGYSDEEIRTIIDRCEPFADVWTVTITPNESHVLSYESIICKEV